jgi:hypothetical protein
MGGQPDAGVDATRHADATTLGPVGDESECRAPRTGHRHAAAGRAGLAVVGVHQAGGRWGQLSIGARRIRDSGRLHIAATDAAPAGPPCPRRPDEYRGDRAYAGEISQGLVRHSSWDQHGAIRHRRRGATCTNVTSFIVLSPPSLSQRRTVFASGSHALMGAGPATLRASSRGFGGPRQLRWPVVLNSWSSCGHIRSRLPRVSVGGPDGRVSRRRPSRAAGAGSRRGSSAWPGRSAAGSRSPRTGPAGSRSPGRR